MKPLGRIPGINRKRSSDLARLASLYWSRTFSAGGMKTWMAEEVCRGYINKKVTGDIHEWPIEWFGRVYAEVPFEKGLSIGCGEGALERDVRRKQICRNVEGIDISATALEVARSTAEAEGLSGIRYSRGDFNRFQLPPSHYDIVFVHQAMHHVAELEHCMYQIASTLKQGGLLYLDEYIGPSRTEWRQELLLDVNRVYRKLPAALRLGTEIPEPVENDDPSEAIRSSEIIPVMEEYFQTVDRRDYGGNLLALITPYIRWDSLDPSQRFEMLLELVAQEERLLETGVGSYYTVIVAAATHNSSSPW